MTEAGDDMVVLLLDCPDAGSLLSAAVRAAPARLEIDAGLLYFLQDDGWLRLAAAEGSVAGPEGPGQMIPPDGAGPVAVAARERRPVYSVTEPADRLFGERESVPAVTLPLLVDEVCLGALSFRTARTGGPDEPSRRALDVIALLCAHRLDHLMSLRAETSPAEDATLDQAMRLVRGRSRAARLELAMSSAQVGSFDWDFPSGRLVWDERLCRLFGFEPEEFDGRIETFFDHVHPEDRRRVHRAVEESRVSGVYKAGFRIVRPDEEIRWIDAEARVFHDARRRPQGMIGVAQDRTGEHDRDLRELRRHDLVLSVTRGFGAALSTDALMDSLAEAVLPALGASAVAVYFGPPEGDWANLVGTRGYGPDGVRRLKEAGEILAGSQYLAPLGEGETLFIGSREDYLTTFPSLRVPPVPGHNAWAILPLSTADGVSGVCVIAFASARTFSVDERIDYAGIAGILAQALSRTRLLDERRGQMTELQRMMLPHRLPEIPDLRVCVRYLPGAEGMDVGGDWYDVLSLPGGGAAVVIGDVQGHSAQAAAVMGQLRTAMRAHALEGHDLADLMARGNTSLYDLDTDLFATCCIVCVGRSGTVRMVRAGHPYPLLLEANGRVTELTVPGGLPLGIEAEAAYPVATRPMPPGATLLLYTDGLVEAPGRDYGEGVADLAGRLTRWARARRTWTDLPGESALDDLADHLVAPVTRLAQHDDTAVLLLQRASSPDL
ncbi:SpoIIE family protein phosphatase [Actinomadura roseirufa]|uniref:SpoIIE family protein phosphatase n=1 Tax=Actinomadura roseirufa TaxID=2094049 RepID=UPI001040EB5B|nr:SpoIIE family protein phosphatase [Actinomadura roseirufa]